MCAVRAGAPLKKSSCKSSYHKFPANRLAAGRADRENTDMIGTVLCVLLSDAFVDRAKLPDAQTMPHGQAPRAPGLRRLQQPDAAVPDSDLCPLQDDDDAVKLYGASFGLNTCGDVVDGGQCSSYMRQCPLSCGVCDGTAKLTTLCHCFEVGWSMASECRWDALTLLPYAKLQCGADWYNSSATDLAAINPVMAVWDKDYTLSYALSMGAFFTGDGAKFFRIFQEQYPMTGLQLINFSAEDFRNMGFNVREAVHLYNGFDDFLYKSYRGAPVDSYATYAAQWLELCARGPRLRLLKCVRLHCRLGMTHPAQCGTQIPWDSSGRRWSSILSRCQSRSFSKP